MCTSVKISKIESFKYLKYKCNLVCNYEINLKTQPIKAIYITV